MVGDADDDGSVFSFVELLWVVIKHAVFSEDVEFGELFTLSGCDEGIDDGASKNQDASDEKDGEEFVDGGVVFGHVEFK